MDSELETVERLFNIFLGSLGIHELHADLAAFWTLANEGCTQLGLSTILEEWQVSSLGRALNVEACGKLATALIEYAGECSARPASN
jgi:hypothetical protein